MHILGLNGFGPTLAIRRQEYNSWPPQSASQRASFSLFYGHLLSVWRSKFLPRGRRARQSQGRCSISPVVRFRTRMLFCKNRTSVAVLLEGMTAFLSSGTLTLERQSASLSVHSRSRTGPRAKSFFNRGSPSY